MTPLDAEFARALVSCMGSGQVAVDLAGRVITLNQSAARLLTPGRSPEEALGRPCQEVLVCQPRVLRLLLDTLAGREIPGRAELFLAPIDSAPPRTIGFSAVAVREAGGGLLGAALWFRDLTPFERMDEQERLRERLAALGQMAAGLAHEIRNPLAGVEVLAGLLKRRLQDRPEERSLVEDLLEELRAVARTVTTSLEFVKPVTLAWQPLDPTKLLDDCLAVATARVPFAGRVERTYADDLPTLSADAEQLSAVLADLIVNAFEAMGDDAPPDGHLLRLGLRVDPVGSGALLGDASETSQARRELVISISDTGPGVPPEIVERIFYPFFSTKDRGSGVGLANAHKVVGTHGGSIEHEGSSGLGATFRVRIPLEPAC